MGLLDNLEKQECIGKGSYATVHKCLRRYPEEDGLGDPRQPYLAVKILDLDKCHDVSVIEREVTLLRQMKHKHIANMIDVEEHGSKIWMLLELGTLGSISALLKAKGKMPESVAAVVLHALAQGVAYLHDNGWAHMDIKTSNLVLTSSGVVKVCDFGVAVYLGTQNRLYVGDNRAEDSDQKRIAESGSTGDQDWLAPVSLYAAALQKKAPVQFAGTPFYMAPEIVRQEFIAYKSDIWSLGIVAIELVDGEVPRHSMHPLNVMKMIAQGLPIKAKTPLSKKYQTLVDAALNNDADQRVSAGRLLAADAIVKSGKSPKKLLAFAKNYALDTGDDDGDSSDDEEENDIRAAISREMLKQYWDFS